jgi:hypothetical protein
MTEFPDRLDMFSPYPASLLTHIDDGYGLARQRLYAATGHPALVATESQLAAKDREIAELREVSESWRRLLTTSQERLAIETAALREAIAMQSATIGLLRRELEMQSAAEPEDALPSPAAWLASRTYYRDLAGTIDLGSFAQIEFLKLPESQEAWCKRVLGLDVVEVAEPTAPASLSSRAHDLGYPGWDDSAEPLSVRVFQALPGDPLNCGCPVWAHDHTALCPRQAAEMTESIVLPPKRIVAGHQFEGAGSSRRCVLGECSRFWYDIADCTSEHVGKLNLAHAGGLNAMELDQIVEERSRLADIWAAVEQGSSRG